MAAFESASIPLALAFLPLALPFFLPPSDEEAADDIHENTLCWPVDPEYADDDDEDDFLALALAFALAFPPLLPEAVGGRLGREGKREGEAKVRPYPRHSPMLIRQRTRVRLDLSTRVRRIGFEAK